MLMITFQIFQNQDLAFEVLQVKKFVPDYIFLMNLFYALHFYKIAACPAHRWHNNNKDKQIMRELSLSESEKVICVIPIGIPKDKFKTTLSLRRDNNEILKVV
jgi:nitroreductase